MLHNAGTASTVDINGPRMSNDFLDGSTDLDNLTNLLAKTSEVPPVDVVNDHSSVVACYINGGSGCVKWPGTGNINLWWKAPGSSSPGVLPSWITEDGSEISINPVSLTEGGADLTAAIGTGYIYFTLDPVPWSSKLYTDSTYLTEVPSEGFSY